MCFQINSPIHFSHVLLDLYFSSIGVWESRVTILFSPSRAVWAFTTQKLSFVVLNEIIWAQDFLPLCNTFLETFDLAWPESL